MAFGAPVLAKLTSLISCHSPRRGRAVTLAKPDIVVSNELAAYVFGKLKLPFALPIDDANRNAQFDSDWLFRSLGYEDVINLQYGEEGGGLACDLNDPATVEPLAGSAALVFDHAVLEHVFHIPNALRAIGTLLRVGGCVVHHVPANNEFNHGFYQISPQLLYLYYATNGYQVLAVELDCYQDYWYAERHDFVDIHSPMLLQQLRPAAYSAMVILVARKMPESTCGVVPQQWGPFTETQRRHLETLAGR